MLGVLLGMRGATSMFFAAALASLIMLVHACWFLMGSGHHQTAGEKPIQALWGYCRAPVVVFWWQAWELVGACQSYYDPVTGLVTWSRLP